MELPKTLSAVLSENFLFPGEQKAVMELVEHTPPPPTTAKFVPPDPHVKLQLSKNATVRSLTTLIDSINAFVRPLTEYISIFVCFKLHPSKIFCTFLDKEVESQVLPMHTDEPGQDLEKEVQERLPTTTFILRNALQHTIALIGKMMRLVDLCQLSQYIKMIECVCCLKQCQEDPDFREVSKWAEALQKEEEREDLTSATTKTMWENVHNIFFPRQNAILKRSEHFSKIADSVDFYHFLEEKQFTGRKGEVLFRQQFELVTAQLQHEEYNEIVLNHLFAAFKFISPFTDSGQSFSSLLKAVSSLDTTEGLTQLDTVKNNMHLIRLWFSRAEVSPKICHGYRP